MQEVSTSGYELSSQQKAWWKLGRVGTCCQWEVEVRGEWHQERLRSSFEGVVSRHEALRAGLVEVRGLSLPLWRVEESASIVWSEGEEGVEEGPELLEREAERLRAGDEHSRVAVRKLSTGSRRVVLTVRGLNADLASLEQVFEEWSRAASGAGLEAVGVQYGQFSAWQDELMAGEESESGRRHWVKQREEWSATRLPWEREGTGGRGRVACEVSESTRRRWCELGESGGGAAGVLLGAWGHVLRRVTGERAGVSVRLAGRGHDELRELVGLVEKWAPLSVVGEEWASLSEAARGCGEQLEEAQEWGESLEMAESELRGAAFEYDEGHWSVSRGGLDWTRRSARGAWGGWTVCLRGEGCRRLELSYDTGRLEEGEARRLLGYVERVLEWGVSHPREGLGGLGLVGAEERERLLSWAEGGRAADVQGTLVERLARWAREHGERVALVCGGESLSYGELNEQANRLGRWLRGRGVAGEECVGLCVGRTVRAGVGMWGIWKSGAAYVALEGDQPVSRLREQARVAGLKWVVTDAAYAGAWQDCGIGVVRLDGDEWCGQSGEELSSRRDPDELAYVLYTSGSTGTPKGVGVSHAGLMNYTSALAVELGVGAGEAWSFASVTTLNADLGHTAVWVGWATGGTVHLVDYEVSTDGVRLGSYLSEHGIDVLKIVPSHLRALLETGESKLLPRRVLVLGGEALGWELVERIRELGGACAVMNHYGPTETTVGALTRRVGAEERGRGGVELGRPISGMRAYVLDEAQQLVPAGVTGELWLGGAGLARGYVGAAGQTAERFLPDMLRGDGTRLYRTGDRARVSADGQVEFLGRGDAQVKIRGYRIEPGEVEAALRRHADVGDAAVVVRTDVPGQPYLAAYVAPLPGRSASVAGRARHRLPNNLAVADLNPHETEFFYRQIFEDRNNFRHGIHLREGACVFDVGANIGLFSVWVAQACPGARIFAFEPLRPIHEVLALNAALYAPGARLFECGLSSASRKVRFSYYPQSTCMSGYYGDAERDRETLRDVLRREAGRSGGEAAAAYAEEIAQARAQSESYLCQLRTLSEVMAESGVDHVDLLKLDVERAELDVLLGLREDDWPKLDQIAIEAHAVGDQLQRLEALLRDHGFDVVTEQDPELAGTELFNVYAVRRGLAAPAGGRAHPLDPPDTAHPAPAPFLEAAALRAHLASALPAHMVPAELVLMEALPLTPNGKLDRRALPAPRRADDASGHVPPETWQQEVLSQIWADVLGRARVGTRDNFFDLGGDSLRSIQVVSRARERGLSLSLSQLHEHPTIADLANVVDEGAAGVDGVPATAPFALVPEIDRARLPQGLDDAYPLSLLQAGMLFHSELSPDSAVFLDRYGVTLRARFDAPALTGVVRAAVERHPVLRTTVDFNSFSQPLQCVHAALEPPFEIHDLTALDADARQARLAQWSEDERRRRFAGQPLWHIAVHRLEPDLFRFTLAFHHAILDGWSVASLLAELFQSYAQALRGEAPSVTAPASEYRDFVAAEQATLEDASLEAFWRARLQDAVPCPLPRWPAAARGSATDETRERVVPVPADVSAGLLAVARREAVPVKSVLLAAHVRVAVALSGRTDVVTGLISNGRLEQRDADRVLGLYLNTLPFRIQAEGGDWSGLVREVFRLERELLPRRRYPFARIRQAGSGRELFETVFNFTRYHVYERLRGFDDIAIVDGSIFERANFPLVANFGLDPAGERVQLTLKCNTSELADAQVDAIAGYYERALADLARDPAGRHDALELLSERERRQQLVDWNATSRDYARDRLIDDAWSERVQAQPDALALSCGERRLTYAELDRAADAVATALRARGVERGRPVALLTERAPEMIAAMLGVLKAGGAYVPLDPRAPATRTAAIVAQLERAPVLSHETLRAHWDALGAPVIAVDVDAPADVAPLPRDPRRTPDDLAYVIFTSGSTGEPKGVTIDHRSVLNLVAGLDEHVYRRYPARLNVALVASYVFDASVQQIFAALLLGHTLCIVPEEARGDGRLLLDCFARDGIEVTDGAPGTLSVLLAVSDTDRRERLPRLRLKHMVIGGEALPSKRVSAFRRAYGAGIAVTNIYGPAECCVDSTACLVGERIDESLDGIPIGSPLANKRVYVLGPGQRLLPVGVPGEIHIAGEGLSRGYLGRDDLTRERFLPDPVAGDGRMYRTGDLARWLPDGNLEFLARMDGQVKVRGYRVEVGEVETALLRHPGVKECVVMARTRRRAPSAAAARHCAACALPSNVPGVHLDEAGVCNVCREYAQHAEQCNRYFRSEEDLRGLVDRVRGESAAPHDCLLLFSGGKDSTYVLYRLVELGLRVLAFTFDNGFISAAAFRNIERTTDELGVERIVLGAHNMNEIFAESLRFNSTVCSGCFKALTTLSTRLALERRIGMVVTGLSRGQIYDTKLAGFFERRIFDVEQIEQQLALFRKLYHVSRDRMSSLLPVRIRHEDEAAMDRMHFVDFFRYCSVSKGDVLEYLKARDRRWERPEDTGFCSTNCRMNDVGIEVHLRDRGFHNYAVPLSWDVRLGHISREAALAELQAGVDGRAVAAMLQQIGYDPQAEEARGEGNYLCAWVVTEPGTSVAALREHLRARLPDYMVPAAFVPLEALPVTTNGKVDRAALPEPARDALAAPGTFVPPRTHTETVLAELWKTALSQPRVGVEDDFFALGGHSLLATQVAARIRETFQVDLPLRQLFETTTLGALAAAIDQARAGGVTAEEDDAIVAQPREGRWMNA